MSDVLTKKAMVRLQALGNHNGMPAERIKLTQTNERTIVLRGDLHVTPSLQLQSVRYAGEGRGRIDKGFRSRAELQSYADTLQKQFRADTDWLQEIRADIQALLDKGWASATPQFRFDKRVKNLAATEPCPECAGRGASECENCAAKGQLICKNCNGQGMEICQNCNGSGMNLLEQGQACNYCNGQRYTACRHCSGQRTIACPACRGRRTIACPPCEGKGMFTEQLTVNYVADLNFSMGSGRDMPVALRRALDRKGGINLLAHGHATITSTEDENTKADHLLIHYQAELPVAELLIDFASKVGKVTAFGHKAVLLEVPPFLDMATAPGRRLLTQAAKQGGDLSPIRRYALLASALDLALQGARQGTQLLRRVPLGLSRKVADEIMRDAQAALKKQSGLWRYLLAGLSVLIGGVASYALLRSMAPSSLQLLAPAMVGGLVIYMLQAVGVGLILRQQHPGQKVGLLQPPSRTVWVSLGIFLAAYAVALALLVLPAK